MVALCGARGGDLRSATFPRLAPPRLQVPEVWLGPNFERFLERCPLDSEFSCDNIWVSKCMFFLRSSRVTDGWLSLPPLNTDHSAVNLEPPSAGPLGGQNTAKSPGFSVARCPSVARRPIRPTIGYATATNVDVLLRVVCGPCRGERWTSKCRSTCRFKRSSDEHGKDHHEELRRSPAARSRPRGWY